MELKGAIGCTQVTEILYTPGVVLVAPLPAPFALATVYSVAVSADSMASAPARAFAALLTGDAAIGLRRSAGFLAAT